MSFEGELSPCFDLRCLRRGGPPVDGWGIGYYGGTEPYASVLKEALPSLASGRSQIARTGEHMSSSTFLLHIRAARWGRLAEANTQPFRRSWARRDWLFVHAGSLDQRLEPRESPQFEPVGSTDTEVIFCELLGRMAARGWRSLRAADLAELHGWLEEINGQGVLTIGITDGDDLIVYADRRGIQRLYAGEIVPPYAQAILGDDDLQIDLTRRGTVARRGVVLTTNVLERESELAMSWREVTPGSLLLVRQGVLVAERAPEWAQPPWGGPQVSSPARPRVAPPRRLEVHHRTIYRYDQPVQRSTHVLRLEPVHDRLQRLASHQLVVSVEGKHNVYDDVFGNRARRVFLELPYTELIIDSHAMVVALDTDPLEFRPVHARTTIPLNWMPWQRHMLQPYLVPPELPESQLIELHDYAMSFVMRNGFDLVNSLIDLNQSIFRDYAYRQGTTTLATTAYEVYVTRQGVCQDFTNLFICLARLLGIPARYVVGYLYTGPKQENRAMGEATHAWAQVYLPEAGWKGFDPTNGVLTQTNHVRVAVGRHYTDATPTSGTIFAGGGAEQLEVVVTVEEEG